MTVSSGAPLVTGTPTASAALVAGAGAAASPSAPPARPAGSWASSPSSAGAAAGAPPDAAVRDDPVLWRRDRQRVDDRLGGGLERGGLRPLPAARRVERVLHAGGARADRARDAARRGGRGVVAGLGRRHLREQGPAGVVVGHRPRRLAGGVEGVLGGGVELVLQRAEVGARQRDPGRGRGRGPAGLLEAGLRRRAVDEQQDLALAHARAVLRDELGDGAVGGCGDGAGGPRGDGAGGVDDLADVGADDLGDLHGGLVGPAAGPDQQQPRQEQDERALHVHSVRRAARHRSAAAAPAANALGRPAHPGHDARMRLLVLGGTRFVGRAVVEDAVVDTWAGAPRVATAAAALLRDRVARYGYVSSASVYAWGSHVDEGSPWAWLAREGLPPQRGDRDVHGLPPALEERLLAG